jgi:biopolymer transport protein ExbD
VSNIYGSIPVAQPKRSFIADTAPKWHVDGKEARRTSYCRINAAPYAGIFLPLVFLFAAILPPPHVSFERAVEQVSASHSAPIPGALRDDGIIVTLSESGDVYFASRHFTPSELERTIRECLKRGAEKRIYLNVDSRAYYEDLRSVLSQITSSRVENITFLTR